MVHPFSNVVAVHAGKVIEVVASTEVLAGTGEDYGAHAFSDLVDVDEEAPNLPIHCEIDGVHRGARHRDGGDTIVGKVNLKTGEVSAHGGAPFR